MTEPITTTAQGEARPSFLRNRWGLRTATTYAVIALVLTYIWLHNASAGNKVGQALGVFGVPGALPFFLIAGSHVLAGGGYVLFYLTNPLAYFLIGFAVGAFSNGLRRVLLVSISLLAIMSAAGYYRAFVSPRIKRHQNIEQYRKLHHDRLAANPNEIKSLAALGQYDMMEGNRVEAKKYYEKVVELESATGSYFNHGQLALLHLGLINESLGNPDRAAAYYKSFLNTNPALDLPEPLHAKEYLERHEATGVPK